MANYIMGRKMSRKAVEFDDADFGYRYLDGSANDILKGIKSVEKDGYVPYHVDGPILRTGRRYRLVIDEIDHFWSVARIDRAV